LAGWPGVQTVPMMVMGATDGLHLRAIGIPTDGVQGFFMDRDDIRFLRQFLATGLAACRGSAFVVEPKETTYAWRRWRGLGANLESKDVF